MNHCLCLAEFDYGALRRRPKRVVADVVDGHPQVQALTYFENTSGVIKHFSDSKIEAIQLGTRRLPKRVENVHGVEVFLTGERQEFVHAIDGIRRQFLKRSFEPRIGLDIIKASRSDE